MNLILRPICLFIVLLSCLSQDVTAQVRVVLVGNTADATPNFFDSLQGYLKSSPDNTVLIINGDITDGCSNRRNKQADPLANARLLTEMIRATPQVEAYLLPGDRDWDHSGKEGWDCVKDLERYLEDEDIPNLHWPLDKGCPGPEKVDLDPSVRMIMINTQWWNHPHRKPIPADGECEYIEPDIILEELQDEIEENLDKNVLIVGHFPVYSQGRYGGEFPISDHFTPPIIGGARSAYRQNVGTPMSIENAIYEPFLDKMKEFADIHEGLFFLGGHDHNQQLVGYRNNFVVSSGAPSKARWVAKHKPALFTAAMAGFCVMEFGVAGDVTYSFLELKDDALQQRTEYLMYDKPCIPEEELQTIPNPNYQPCLTEVFASQLNPQGVPPGYTAQGGDYSDVSKFYQLFFGKHYRTSWDQEITPKVLDLETELGGLYPTKRGGGRQTRSLKLETESGERFVFRSVDKDPAGALSFELRKTIIADITRDQTSTQHPYGALVVSSLLDSVDILHAHPRLFVMSDGLRLGHFRNPFSFMLGTLEERPDGAKKNRPGTFGADEVYKSYELFNERYNDQDLYVNYEEFARARLFDIVIGDWSKHEDNWKWAGFDGPNGRVDVRPIPRDRDHAFSQLDGFFPWLASRRWAVQNLEHFDYRIQDIRSLTYQARNMDRLLMSPLSREQVVAEARYLQQQIGDNEIREAVNTLPPELISLSGNEIGDKLTQRIADLEEYANTYYELHARIVDVVGTNKAERFSLTRPTETTTRVVVSDLKGNQKGRVLYDRTFLESETDEIRLYGLGDKDEFILSGDSGQRTKIRIIGGPGKDIIQDETRKISARRSIYVYERSTNNDIQLSSNAKRINSWRDELYQYNRKAYEYNNYFPIVSFGFNSFNGFKLGGGVTFTRRSFTRRDYSSKHRINGSVGTIGNYAFSYTGEWHEAIRKWDAYAGGEIERPSFYNYFFGLGNSSTKDDDAFRDGFNLVRLSHYKLTSGIQRIFWRESSVVLDAGYEHNVTSKIENTILDRDIPYYGTQDLGWVYVKPQLTIDLRDHKVFPSRGLRFIASQSIAKGNNVDFGVSKVAIEMFYSARRFPITLALRSGWASTQGEVPFYQLPSLGNNEGLRGFQRNRFVGDGYFYYNTEFRCPVALWRNPVFPVVLGVRGFFDSGYVKERGNSEKPNFHDAYGGGIYLIPLSRSYTISALLGFSDEESALINLSLGTNF